MRHRSVGRPASGFTLVELLVAMMILIMIATVGIPAIARLIPRLKLEGFARQTYGIVQLAKSEAIKQNVRAVIRVDFANRELVAFTDIDGVAAGSPPDGRFNPVGGAVERTTDYQIARLSLPNGLTFTAPSGNDADRVVGFSVVGTEEVAILLPNGAIQAAGAFRMADSRNNYLEVRVAPQAAARAQVRKWSSVATAWHPRGEGGAWQWN